jgi:hypothetical protein
MKCVLYLLFFIFQFCSLYSQTESLGFKYFFLKSPKGKVAKKDDLHAEVAIPTPPPQSQNLWKPTVVIPALKLVPATGGNTSLNALLLTATGGGISWQHQVWDGSKWNTTFSFSPATFLVSGNIASNSNIDFSYAATVGFFNNLIMIGGGYDFGSVASGSSRFFGLLSIGINLLNN